MPLHITLGERDVCEILLADTAELGTTGRLPISRKEEETVATDRHCQKWENQPSRLMMCRFSVHLTYNRELLVKHHCWHKCLLVPLVYSLTFSFLSVRQWAFLRERTALHILYANEILIITNEILIIIENKICVDGTTKICSEIYFKPKVFFKSEHLHSQESTALRMEESSLLLFRIASYDFHKKLPFYWFALTTGSCHQLSSPYHSFMFHNLNDYISLFWSTSGCWKWMYPIWISHQAAALWLSDHSTASAKLFLCENQTTPEQQNTKQNNRNSPNEKNNS